MRAVISITLNLTGFSYWFHYWWTKILGYSKIILISLCFSTSHIKWVYRKGVLKFNLCLLSSFLGLLICPQSNDLIFLHPNSNKFDPINCISSLTNANISSPSSFPGDVFTIKHLVFLSARNYFFLMSGTVVFCVSSDSMRTVFPL